MEAAGSLTPPGSLTTACSCRSRPAGPATRLGQTGTLHPVPSPKPAAPLHPAPSRSCRNEAATPRGSSTITTNRTHSPPPQTSAFLSKRSHHGLRPSRITTVRTHSPPSATVLRPPRFCRNEATTASAHRELRRFEPTHPRRPPSSDLPVSVETKPPRHPSSRTATIRTHSPPPAAAARPPRFRRSEATTAPLIENCDDSNPLAPTLRRPAGFPRWTIEPIPPPRTLPSQRSRPLRRHERRPSLPARAPLPANPGIPAAPPPTR